MRATKISALLLAMLGAAAACTSPQAPRQAASPQPVPTRATFEAGVVLPDGDGREIVISQCLICHELVALELFRGFYTQQSWRALVLSMRAHGAEVDDAEVEIVSAYLAQHFGTGTP